LKQLLIILLITLIALTIAFSPPALATDTASGAKLFSVQCAGCHVNGGNIVRRGKTLKLKALKRNGVDSLDGIASLVTNGKNNMPAYSDRLSTEQIEDVSAYVLGQAQNGWR
jgi:cytochrome c6